MSAKIIIFQELVNDVAFTFYEDLPEDLTVKAYISSQVSHLTDELVVNIALWKDDKRLVKTDYYIKELDDIDRLGIFLSLLRNNFMTSNL